MTEIAVGRSIQQPRGPEPTNFSGALGPSSVLAPLRFGIGTRLDSGRASGAMAGDVPPPLLFLGGAAVGAALAANALGRRMRRRLRALARAAPRVRVGLEVRENDNDPWRVEPSPDEPSLPLTPDPKPPPARAQVAAEDGWRIFRGKRVGLLTNPTGVMPGTLEHAVDVMLADGVDLRAVFGPEHGFRGIAQAGASTLPSSSPPASSTITTTTTTTASPDDPSAPAFVDPRSGLPVFDVYRKSGADLVAALRRADVEVIAFDMQDVGARFYTYLWTLYDVLVAAAASDPPIRVVVLDRPNPVGGDVVEGPVVVEDGCASFLARKSVALRHGMTLGELARMLNRRHVPTDPDNPSGEPARLAVVPCRGWRRDMTWAETRLPWVPPSPNVPKPETALAYLVTCLFEATNCSEGRGTANPFELIGATWANAAFAEAARARRGQPSEKPIARANAETAGSSRSRARRWAPRPGPAARYREAYFTPTSGPHAGRVVAGMQVLPVAADRALFREGVSLLADARRTYPNDFAWREGTLAPGARLRADRTAGRTTRAMSRAAVFKSPTKARGEPGWSNGRSNEPSDGEGATTEADGAGSGAGPGWAKARRALVAARAFDAAPPTIRRAPFVDLLTGTPRLREALDAPPEETAAAVEEVFEEWEAQLRTFVRVRETYLLY